MSQLKVNALVSYSGNTVTLGTSGDTINVASGVTFSAPGVVNGPAFSAYKDSSGAGNQSINSGTFTKVTYDVETFDTNSNFASSRFTPTVAGYYQINAGLSVETSGSISRVLISLHKNGIEYNRGTDMLAGNNVFVSDIVYCNGSTDYVEVYVFATGTSLVVRSQPYNLTFFSGAMIRGA